MVAKSVKLVAHFLNSSALTRPLIVLGAVSAAWGGASAQGVDPGTLPQGGNVVGGNATMQQSGNTLNVNQSTNRTVIDWRSFDIGSSAQVNFSQPNTSSIAVNRVNSSANPTQIEGGLHANGQVWVLNPNGVFFGKTARVDAAGIVATTANIDTQKFMAGSNRLTMTGADHGSVTNEGSITVGQNGLAAFVAPSVRNKGTINARVGRVSLAAGTTYTLDLAGDRLVEIGLGSVNAVVDQSGKIVNPGGTVVLTAKAAGQVVNSVVNVSGVVDASSVTQVGGEIVLGGDDVTTTSSAVLKAEGGAQADGGAITAVADHQGTYAGTFSAKGGSEGGNGGQIETSGKSLHIDDAIAVDTSAPKGATGNWTLDPDTLTVGSSSGGIISGGINDENTTIAASAVKAALNGTNVTLQAKNAITVDTAIDASLNGSAGNLLLKDQEGGGLTINLNAPITLKTGSVLSGQGTTVNVASGASIQNGVDVALAGATVNVTAGTYTLASQLTISKKLALTGTGAVIDASGVSTATTTRVVSLEADDTTISGFTIKGNGNDVGISIPGKGVTASGNTILNVLTGIQTNTSYPVGNATITGNIITARYGISLQNRGNTASGNTVTASVEGAGLQEAANTVRDNTFNMTGTGTALQFYDAAHPGTQLPATAATASGLVASGNTVNIAGGDVQGAVYLAGTSGKLNLAAGSYTLPGELDISQSLTLKGAGVGNTIITSNSTGYGIAVTANNTTLSGFTFNGPTATTNSTYGIKVSPLVGPATNRVQAFAIDNVAINGGYHTGLDLNGVLGATIDHVTVSNIVKGTGIALTDSANVTITNTTTNNNAWGGLALYQANFNYDQQETGIVVNGTNTFTEVNGIYAQDQSSTNDFGTINVTGQGFQYVAKIAVGGTEGDYTYFQKTQQNAIDIAGYANAKYSLTGASVQGYSGANLAGNNIFTVGITTGGQQLSIGAAIGAAQSGGTINVRPGTYQVSGHGVISKNLSLVGDATSRPVIQTTVDLTGINAADAWILVNSGVTFGLSNLIFDGAGHQVWQALRSNGNTTVDNVTFRNIMGSASGQPYKGVAIESFGGTVAGGAGADSNGAGGAASHLTVTNSTFENIGRIGVLVKGTGATATISGNTFTGKGTGDFLDYGVEVGASGTATITGNTITNNKGVASVDGSTSAGILVTSYYGGASHATITNNTITNSTSAVDIGYNASDISVVTATGNTFKNNNYGVELASTTATANFSGNTFSGNNIQFDGTSAAVTSILANNTLDKSVYLTGGDTIFSNIQDGVNAATAGATVNVGAGHYAPNVTINKSNLSLLGAAGAEIDVDPGTADVRAISIGNTNGVRVSGFTIRGEINVPYVNYSFGAGASRGIAVARGATNFTISNNDIRNIRTGIIIDGIGSTGGAVTGNTIDNTKSAVYFQYTDDSGVNVSRNLEGPIHNEWGVNYHVNGYWNGSEIKTNPYPGGAAPGSVQTQMLTNSAANSGWSVQDQAYTSSNRTSVYVGLTTPWTNPNGNQGSPREQLGTIQDGVNAVVSGGTVNVSAGSYTLASTLNIGKSLTLKGAGVGSTIITSNATNNYGINVTGNNTTLSSFTFNGPTAVNSSTYGIKVSPSGSPSSRLLTFAIDNVAINGSNRTGLDLNGVKGATIDHVTVTNTKNGNGITLTDSANVTITNTTTTNNTWGGLALYQSNFFYDQQVTGITVDATNTFNEAIPVYLEDQSDGIGLPAKSRPSVVGGSGLDFGTVSIAGFDYAVRSPNAANDVYTWLQKTQQKAIDFATSATLGNGNVNVPSAYINGWTGGGTDNLYTVGVSTGGQAMSINAAVNASSSSAVINVLDGTYAEAVTVGGARTLNLGTVTVNSLTLAAGAAGTQISGKLSGGSIALNGAVTLSADLTLDTSAKNGAIVVAAVDGKTAGAQTLTLKAGTGNVSLGDVGATTQLAAVSDLNATTLTGSTYAANSLGFGALTLAKDAVLNASTIAVASVDGTTAGGQALTLNGAASLGDVGATTQLGAVSDANAATLTGSTYNANSLGFGALTLTKDTVLNAGTITLASVDGTTAGGQALTLKGTIASLGNLGATTQLGAVSDTANTVLTGATYAANSLGFGAVTLTKDTTLNAATIAVASVDGTTAGGQALTLNGAASLGDVGATTQLGAVSDANAATLTGSTYNANSLGFGALTLTKDTILNAGTITLASVDGTTAGGQALTLNGATSLGDVGVTTRLGAVSDATAATLTGSIYAANGLNFGALTLTKDTVLNAGTITLASVDGTTAGGQALTLTGGPASLGDVGATTRLAAVSDGTATTLTGSTYAAKSFTFIGPVTLTAATTTLNSAGGDIAFGGDIFGSTNGGQSLVLNAGPGLALTAAATANGVITMLNAGTKTVRLNNLTVSGNSFTALTVALAGNFVSHLTGDQVFAADTLDTLGSVDSTVAGNAAGHIVASGAVTMGVTGGLSGTISGGDIALTTGSISNSTVTGTGNLTVASQTVTGATLGGSNVTVNTNSFTGAVSGSNVNLTAGTLSNANVTSTGGLVLASQSVTGSTLSGSNVTVNASSFTGTVSGSNVNMTTTTLSNANVTSTGGLVLASQSVSGSTLKGSNVTVQSTSFNGNVTATDTANIQAATIGGTFSGNTVTLAATDTVTANVTANTLTMSAPQGDVKGTWTSATTTGNGTLVVNGQSNLGNSGANANQLVVEGFALPLGTEIRPSGEIVLPQGLVLALLSPGGDSKPRAILVHDVRRLGELLEAGYAAIVMDLSGREKKKETLMALN